MPGSPLRASVRVRWIVALIVGFVVGFAVGPFLGTAAGLLAGWAAGAATAVTWILLMVWRMDAAQTRAHATAEEPGRTFARFVSLLGSLASLGAVAVVIIETRNAGAVLAFTLAGVALVSVIASWLLIQTDYMLRIAGVYYSDPVGGIEFNQDEEPMYTDFAYVAFGLGLAYQIADTNVTTNAMRRIVLPQTLIAYFFGAIILAATINLVAGLG
jgi:uncharacterized membrane protein